MHFTGRSQFRVQTETLDLCAGLTIFPDGKPRLGIGEFLFHVDGASDLDRFTVVRLAEQQTRRLRFR
jgi:hypothetical protein